jgi:hypothetical protein
MTFAYLLKGVHNGPVEEPDTDAAELHVKDNCCYCTTLNPKFLEYLHSKINFLLYANFLICINLTSTLIMSGCCYSATTQVRI